jgi:hypothetical protein
MNVWQKYPAGHPVPSGLHVALHCCVSSIKLVHCWPLPQSVLEPHDVGSMFEQVSDPHSQMLTMQLAFGQ